MNYAGSMVTPDHMASVRQGFQCHERHSVVECWSPNNGGLLIEGSHVCNPSVELNIIWCVQFLSGKEAHDIEPDGWHSAGYFQHLIDSIQCQAFCGGGVAQNGELLWERVELAHRRHPSNGHIFAFEPHSANFFREPGSAGPMDFFRDPGVHGFF